MKKKTWIVTMRVVDEPLGGTHLLPKEDIIDYTTKREPLIAGLSVTRVSAKVQK